jgi:large subunit ribosomal protein L25
MNINKLEFEPREERKSNAMKRLRKSGFVPCVLYGLKQEPRMFKMHQDILNAFLREGTRMADLKMGDQVQSALLKDVQYDYLGEKVLHADFVRVNLAETLKIRVPLKFTGMAKGQAAGGILEHKFSELEVECLPGNIPEEITVSLQDLDVGQSIQIKELTLPDGVKCTLEPETALVTVTVVAEEEAEPEAAEPEGEESAEPEVIQRKDKAEEDQEGKEGKEE